MELGMSITDETHPDQAWCSDVRGRWLPCTLFALHCGAMRRKREASAPETDNSLEFLITDVFKNA
jgi:hypothetical protein